MQSGPLRSAPRCSTAGLSLVETLICVGILGLLAALAGPPLRSTLTNYRIAGVRSELTAAIQWARWEALRRNTTVTLLRRTDCATPLLHPDDWHCGWHLLAGPHITKTSVPNEAEVLQAFSVPPGLRLVHPGGGPALQFARSGYPVLVAHKFTVGLPADVHAGATATGRATTLCMNRTGRVRAREGHTTC